MGDSAWSHLFVTKLLVSGKGQCHSLPLLYLILIEELGAKAFLSLSPQHSFIQYFDDRGRRYNFETTNGNLVSQAWLMQSTYVNATAMRNRTYLDTLSSVRLYAYLLGDLLQNYINKLGYDSFTETITRKILSIDSSNTVALMVQANICTYQAMEEIRKVDNPPLEKLAKFPNAWKAYQKMTDSYKLIEATGFQEMSADLYQAWRGSMDQRNTRRQPKKAKKPINTQRK